MNRQTVPNILQAKVAPNHPINKPHLPHGTQLPAGKRKGLSCLNQSNAENIAASSKPQFPKGLSKVQSYKENLGIGASSFRAAPTQRLAKPVYKSVYCAEQPKLPLPFTVYCDEPDIKVEDKENLRHQNKENIRNQKSIKEESDEIPQPTEAFFLHSPLKECPASYREKDREEEEIVVYDSPMIVDNSLENLSLKDEPPGKELLIPEYTQEIYSYLRTVETKIRPRVNYMRKQSDITSGMRRILVDWLVEVSLEYKLNEETLYLAVSYIDRFLSCMAVLRCKLQLVGTACMFIAAKYEEIYPPDVSEFVYITDDTYSKLQVLRMEHLVLKVLSFDLAVPTTNFFLQRFCSLCSVPATTESLAKYLCELSLLDADRFLRFLPSEIACAGLALANYTLGKELWNSELQLVTGYIEEDFRVCLENLHALYQEAATCPQQAIQEKYRSNRFRCVSAFNPPPPLPPLIC